MGLYLLRGPGVLVNKGLFFGGLVLLALACYHFVAGITLHANETDALVAATKTVGFTVGHASAQLSWRGLLSHPTWRINPPKKLVRRGPGHGQTSPGPRSTGSWPDPASAGVAP